MPTTVPDATIPGLKSDPKTSSTGGPTPDAAGRRLLPFMFLLFVGSGCAALNYEIVWLQLLQLSIGSTAVSLGVLLGTFMGGMCLGSVLLPRFISARHHPLRVYALLEAGIGLFGILLWFYLPPIAHFYAAHGGVGMPAILMRGLVCAVCLLPPTLLMGATLPGISRWIETTPNGVAWLGFFYGGNIAGAVTGCLLAGFYLLRVFDMGTATFVSAMINGCVALAALLLAMWCPRQTTEATTDARAVERAPGARWVYIAIALSGMGALGAEVIWTRLLSLLLGGTTYTFSIILAVFLTGLGAGSSLGSAASRLGIRPRVALGWCQALLSLGIAWTAWMIARSLPYWPIDPAITSSPWYSFQLDLARCLWGVLPATFLWGASFPLALAAVAAPRQDPARLVGGVYAANTVGAIVGALAASLILIAWIGTERSQQVLVGIATLAAVLVFATQPDEDGKPARNGPIFAAVAIVLGGFLAFTLPPLPLGLVTEGRNLAKNGETGKALYVGEGRNSSVAVTELSDGTRNFHVSGKIEASTEPKDMRLQRMLGHIPGLLHGHPRSILVVGCGAGVTAGSFLTYPSVTNITICEIEPLIPEHVAKEYFGPQNYNVVTDPRVHIVYDDARDFVLTTKQKFDIITSDPIHPWVKGAASLYTKEYFEIVKQHLNPGGMVTQWVPLYESNLGVVKSEVATFFDVFPEGTIWGNDDAGRGYDTVMLGQNETMHINVDALEDWLQKPEHKAVLDSLENVGFNSAVDLLGTYAGNPWDMKPWLQDAEINRDRNLRLQYLAGMGNNLYQELAIFNEMENYRRYPEDLFFASSERRVLLEVAIQRASAHH